MLRYLDNIRISVLLQYYLVKVFAIHLPPTEEGVFLLVSLIKILYINVVILGLGVTILNYGYEVQSPDRHNLYYMLMIIQLIASRILMCIYFERKNVEYIGGSTNG